MPATLAVATGNHGWHLYYRHPGRPVLSRPLPGVAGVDVKADGGYSCCRPRCTRSRDAGTGGPTSGISRRCPRAWPKRSRHHRRPRRRPLAAVPVSVRRPASGHTGAGGGLIRYPDGLVGSCLAAVRSAPEGRRRVTLYGAARGVARTILAGHLTHDAGVELLTEAGRAADQTDRDIHAAITGGFAAEGLSPS